jgi:hypothetical protein
MTRSTGRSSTRLTVIGVCGLAVAVLFAGVVRQAWTSNSAQDSIVDQESIGAATMHNLMTLLSSLVEAQNAAVRGDKVDPNPVHAALTAVTTGGQRSEYGSQPLKGQRITDLASQIESTFARGETGRAAYDSYSTLVTLCIDLMRGIGDSSHLIHDPDLDSYYLMDAAIVRLPDAMVYAGRASDLVQLAGGKALGGEDEVRAAVARFDVSFDAEQVAAGLTKSVDSTDRAQLGSNIEDRLDTFKAAADAFAPPTMLSQLATNVDATALAANARRVYAAATSLAHLLLSELQALLEARTAKLAGGKRFVAVAAVLATLLALLMAWLAIMGRPRRVRATGRASVPGTGDLPVGSMTYARDLLENEELASAGRLLRSRSRGGSDAL